MQEIEPTWACRIWRPTLLRCHAVTEREQHSTQASGGIRRQRKGGLLEVKVIGILVRTVATIDHDLLDTYVLRSSICIDTGNWSSGKAICTIKDI